MMIHTKGIAFTRALTGLLLLCCAVTLVTGCTSNQFIGTPDGTPLLGTTITGSAHGGNQPVIGASVQLWAAGSTGYGSKPTALGSPVSTVGPNGTFSIGSYTCPTASTQVYLTATGGNPGLSGNNPNLVMAAALGNCSAASGLTGIDINEVTTTATAYSLSQYFAQSCGTGTTIADCIGAPNTTQAQTALANAMQTVTTLATLGGAAVTSNTLSGAGGSTTVTPQSAKLNTIADILASCVNSAGGTQGDSSNCGVLFGDVAPTGVTLTDTFQAAVYMDLNPTCANSNSNAYTANMAAVFGLAAANTAFQPSITSQPTDWTLAIAYSGTTTLSDPQNIAIDTNGNVWIVNHNGTTSASLTELSSGATASMPPGTAIVNVSTIGGQSISAIQPRNEAIDTNNNVFLDTTSSARVLEYNGGTGISISPAGGGSPYGIAIDGNNNIFFTHESSSATSTVEEFLNDTLASSAEVEYGLATFSGANQQPEYAAIDTSGNLWMTNGSSTAGLESNIFQMSGYNGSNTTCTVFPCTAATTGDTTLTQTYTNMVSGTGGVPTLTEPWGIAAAAGGVVWVADFGSNVLTRMTSTTAGTNFGDSTSLNKPQYVAIDGAGNVWTSDSNTGSTNVSELSSSGKVLSPVNTGTAPYTAVGFAESGMVGPAGIGVDPSGNVWVASMNSSTGGVYEIVGAAAPTVTPIALALKNGTVGAKP